MTFGAETKPSFLAFRCFMSSEEEGVCEAWLGLWTGCKEGMAGPSLLGAGVWPGHSHLPRLHIIPCHVEHLSSMTRAQSLQEN